MQKEQTHLRLYEHWKRKRENGSLVLFRLTVFFFFFPFVLREIHVLLATFAALQELLFDEVCYAPLKLTRSDHKLVL